jgi:hypothetical protein
MVCRPDRTVFTWVQQQLAAAGLLKGQTVAIDATTLEANAAMRSIVRRDTGEGYVARGLQGRATPARGWRQLLTTPGVLWHAIPMPVRSSRHPQKTNGMNILAQGLVLIVDHDTAQFDLHQGLRRVVCLTIVLEPRRLTLRLAPGNPTCQGHSDTVTQRAAGAWTRSSATLHMFR